MDKYYFDVFSTCSNICEPFYFYNMRHWSQGMKLNSEADIDI